MKRAKLVRAVEHLQRANQRTLQFLVAIAPTILHQDCTEIKVESNDINTNYLEGQTVCMFE